MQYCAKSVCHKKIIIIANVAKHAAIIDQQVERTSSVIRWCVCCCCCCCCCCYVPLLNTLLWVTWRMLYVYKYIHDAIVHWQMHSRGWVDCMRPCYIKKKEENVPRHVGSHTLFSGGWILLVLLLVLLQRVIHIKFCGAPYNILLEHCCSCCSVSVLWHSPKQPRRCECVCVGGGGRGGCCCWLVGAGGQLAMGKWSRLVKSSRPSTSDRCLELAFNWVRIFFLLSDASVVDLSAIIILDWTSRRGNVHRRCVP